MIILGIGPGLGRTGWGVIADGYRVSNPVTISGIGDVHGQTRLAVRQLSYIAHGVIKTKPSNELGVRLNHIFQEVSEVVEQCHPDIGAIEDLYVNALNPRSTLKLGCARGAAFTAMSSKGLSVKEYAPTVVKKVVSGYGLADKDLVASRVMLILGKSCPMISKDAADALAIAICGLCCSKLPKAA